MPVSGAPDTCPLDEKNLATAMPDQRPESAQINRAVSRACDLRNWQNADDFTKGTLESDLWRSARLKKCVQIPIIRTKVVIRYANFPRRKFGPRSVGSDAQS